MPRDSRVYLEDILEAIQRIRSYTAGYTKERFRGDPRTVDAVVRNLEVVWDIVESKLYAVAGLLEEENRLS